MIKILDRMQFVLFFIVLLCTMYATMMGHSYAITGILGLIILTASIIREKRVNKSKVIDSIFWGASIILAIGVCIY